jgi:hypothetical protein
MHRRLALGRCSATDADSSRPGRATGPSLLLARRRSWGSVAPFAGLLPHTGGGSFLIGPGPPACSSSRRAPIDFRRVDSPLPSEEKHESRDCAADHVRLDWLLGFDSRLRSVSPSSAATLRPVEPGGIVPALGLSSLRYAGTTSVHSNGLDPVRNHQAPTALSAPSLRSWAYIRVERLGVLRAATRKLPFSVVRPDALPLRAF